MSLLLLQVIEIVDMDALRRLLPEIIPGLILVSTASSTELFIDNIVKLRSTCDILN